MEKFTLSIAALVLTACASAPHVREIGRRTQKGPVLVVDVPMNDAVSEDQPAEVTTIVVATQERKAEIQGLLAATLPEGMASPEGKAFSMRGPGHAIYDTGVQTVDEFVGHAASVGRTALAANGPGTPLDAYPFPYDRTPADLRALLRADLRTNYAVLYRLVFKKKSSGP